MNSKSRNDLLYALVQNYVLDKRKNQVLMRENDTSYIHSKGMFQGACMAFECEIVETGEVFQTVYQCALKIKGSDADIHRCLNGKCKTHKGYHFEEVK